MARRLIKKHVRTRFCCCQDLECRFIHVSLPCPNGKLPNGNDNPIGTWLWGTAFVDEETDEEVVPSADDVLVEEIEQEETNDQDVPGN